MEPREDWPDDLPDDVDVRLDPIGIVLPHDFRPFRVGEFMDRAACFYAVRPNRIVIGYRDATGSITTRPITTVEVINCCHQLYISGFCQIRLEMRTFRLDRVAYMMRVGRSERVDPRVEVLRWLLD